MSLEMSEPRTMALRLEELERENAALREQIRRAATQQVVSRGALAEAVQEKEVAARIASQVAAEERATRAAVEVQGSSIGFSLVLQVLNFLMLVTLIGGLYFWLPTTLENRLRPATVITGSTSGTVVVPGR